VLLKTMHREMTNIVDSMHYPLPLSYLADIDQPKKTIFVMQWHDSILTMELDAHCDLHKVHKHYVAFC
jgi:hypothetical protein